MFSTSSFNKASNIMVCCLLCYFVKAQKTDSLSHQLKEVTISADKKDLIQASKKTNTIDTLILKHYNNVSLADLLTAQSSIHIKSYGNGNIATTSIRGGNATQTAVLWNGLNIQNPMLGQTDLSLLPVWLFDNVALEYGGGASLHGSGAMGGTILLQNKSTFNKGFSTQLQMSVGSFDTKKLATTVQLSYKKINSITRLYYTNSENNYTYKDTNDKEQPIKHIQHANYLSKGFMQELAYAPTTHQTINVRVWYNQLFRNLPSYSAVVSQQHQYDENLKLNADWNYQKNNLKSVIRFGYFNDKLNYHDSLANIYSNSIVKTLVAENENTVQLKQHQFLFGINITSYQSDFELYNMRRELNKLSFFANYKLQLLKQKLLYHISVRKEFTNLSEIPVTGNTGFYFKAHKSIALKINGSKAFRQPTLNDLYWQPGGNPDLKSEEAYEFDGGIELNFKKNNFTILVEGTYFNRHTTNWIIWLPNNTNVWSPQNIAQVYSRGAETKTELGYQQKNTLVKLILNTAYTLSTNQQQKNSNDNSLGKQLAYTPRYTGQSSIYISYKKINFLFSQSYTGYRFTTADNNAWLMPYYMAAIKASYSYQYKKTTFNFFGTINNLFNKNYTAVANRPMPLRNFEMGVSIKYHKTKKE